MLSVDDLLTVIATTLGCTAAVTVVALMVLRLRRLTIAVRFAVVVSAAVAAIVCSTVAIAAEMYLSQHDLTVLLWVVSVSAALSLGAAWIIGQRVRTSIVALGESARRIGDGAIVDAHYRGSHELSEVSAKLADSSERLAAARAEIERLDASRSQFFAWISHDLRTPLTGVRALAEALEEGVVDDQGAYLRRILVQTDTMSRLVDDLFELSRLHSGTLQLRCESIELLDVVSDAVADVHPLADARGIRIAQVGVDGNVVWADPHELTRVIINLLTNSIRHSPPDAEILITAHLSDDDRLVLSVLDQGRGVETKDLARIFEVGWRADTARTPDSTSGAGLGLAIVRGIVEAHGGDVRAEHADGGFRLRISLPNPG